MIQAVALEQGEQERSRPRAGLRRRIEASSVALLVVLAAGGVFLLYAGRHLSFFYDEWTFILERRGGGLSTYLDPHVGHLVLFPVIVYKLLFATVGLRHYAPYRVVGIALHLLCCFLLFKLVSRRLGPWAALGPVVLLLLMGSAWQDLLWPFQIAFLTSIAGGLGALLALERRDTRGDAIAAALLVWSLTGSDLGITFLVAAAAVLIVQRRPWTRAWVVAIPAALFAIWYLGWGTSEPITTDSVLGAPQYVADAASGAAAGIAGLTSAYGPPLAIGGLFLVLALINTRAPAVLPALLVGAAVGLLTFWGLAAVVRNTAPDPTASRYLYVGAVFIWLILAEVLAGVVISRMVLAVLAVLLVGAVISNVGLLRDGERGLRAADDSVRASLTAVEVASRLVWPGFAPTPLSAPVITAGPYLAAVHDLGSPAYTVPALEAAPDKVRAVADSTLVGAEALGLFPISGQPSGSRRIVIEGSGGGRIAEMGTCRVLTPTSSLATIDVAVPAGGDLLLHAGNAAPAYIYLRRFASTYPARRFAVLSAGASGRLRFPTDRVPTVPWHVQVNATSPVELCLR